jgi:hypothetical protein
VLHPGYGRSFGIRASLRGDGYEAVEYKSHVALFGRIGSFRKKAIANCLESAHRALMSEHVVIGSMRGNAGLSV